MENIRESTLFVDNLGDDAFCELYSRRKIYLIRVKKLFQVMKQDFCIYSAYLV